MTHSETEASSTAPDEAVVRFIGEHDLTTRDEVTALLAELLGENQKVTVDLRDATFIDSVFLQCLMVADRNAKAAGIGFDVRVPATGPIRRIIEITHLDQLLEIVVADDPTAGSLPEGFKQTIVE